MSSILDALERAAQERGQGDAQIPRSTVSVAGETQSPLPRLLLLGGVVIGVAVLLLFLFTDPIYPPGITPGEKGQLTGPTVPPVVTAVPKKAIDLRSGRQNKSSLAGDRSVAERIRNSGSPNQRPLVSEAMLSESRGVEALSVVPGPKTRPEDRGKGQTAGKGSVVQANRPMPVEMTSAAASVESPERRVTTQAIRQDRAVSAEPDVEQVIYEEQVEQQQIPLIWELDQGLREALEQLKTSIHVYHQAPSQRFVIINMRRYSEGDNLGINGYRLHAIDRDGIIVYHGNGLVRLLRER
jgi:hypothetical protein